MAYPFKRMLAPDHADIGGRGLQWTGKSFTRSGPGNTRVRYRDKGWLQIVNNMRALDSARVRVGVVGANAKIRHPSGLSMADIATINEFGTDDGHVPSRSFLRSVLRSSKSHAAFRQIAASGTRRLISMTKSSVDNVLNSIGRWAVEEIRQAIGHTIPPPQAKATIQKKGHDGTLRETGALFDAINYVITRWAQHLKNDGGDSTKVDLENSTGSFGDTKDRPW